MKKLLGNRAFLGVLIVVALVAGVAIGGAFFARSVSDNGDGTAAAEEETGSPTTSSTDGASESSLPQGTNGGTSQGQAGGPELVVDPAALRLVEPEGGPPGYAYQEPENSPVPLPPTLPVEVSLSSTDNLRPGDPISIKVVPKPGSGSEMFGFRARLCKKGAEIENLYDFFPVVAPNCIDNPLSPDSDAYVEVKVEPPYQIGEGIFRVGLGTDRFEMEDGSQASVTCSKVEPCQLVLQVHVPYGFGYFKYDLSFA